MVNGKTNGNEINCERVWREVSNYLEGELEETLRIACDEHLQSCARCRSVLEGTRNVIRLYGDSRMIEVPAGFGNRLERRLAQNARLTSRRRWSTWSAWIVPVAALILFAGGLRLANSLSGGEPLKTEHAQQAHGIPPDMRVVVTADAKIFHVAGCPFIHNKETERTLSAREAIQQGYVPCLRCLRKYLNTDVVGRAATVGGNADSYAQEDGENEQGAGQ
jgi:hypothetical protein